MPNSIPSSHTGEPSRKRQKRSYVACFRCHGHKVKCTGGQPCQRCQNANKGAACEYPLRDRRVAVTESYLRQLQDGNGISETLSPSIEVSTDRESRARRQRSVSLHESEHHYGSQPEPDAVIDEPNQFHQEQNSFPQMHGESTCSAFCEKFLKCLSSESASPVPTERQYYRDSRLHRQMTSTSECKLPDRVRAILLIRVALRFIGNDYHFLRRDEFLQQLERAYSWKDRLEDLDAIWTCKLFVVLALGELYSTPSTLSADRTGNIGATVDVPGTKFFQTAVGLLQDLYEEPSTAQVEIMLLFCFYSNALGRTKSAHVYSGLALRMSTCLGMHRYQSLDQSRRTPIEQEHRVRLWWTVYIFDRSTSSRLGLPLSIRDDDIDIQMPQENVEQLGSAEQLIANIELSRITGCIVRDMNGPSSRTNSAKSLIHNMRTNLKKLQTWDAQLPPSLRLGQAPNLPRPAASLQLHFNQCIILTTRPVLLYVLKTKDPFATSLRGTDDEPSQISETAKMLADSCIAAARTSSSVLSQLFTENSLAFFGYFDAHHLFSSALVLIISAILSPNSGDSDAVQTAFYLLKTMRDCGNTIAMDYYTQLAHCQRTIARLRARSLSDTVISTSTHTELHTAVDESAAEAIAYSIPNFEDLDWETSLLQDSAVAHDSMDMRNFALDPLGDPLLQTFLGGQADASWAGNLDI